MFGLTLFFCWEYSIPEGGVIQLCLFRKSKNNAKILLPGMTATVDIIIREIKDAVLVPSQALRYKHKLNKKSKKKKLEEYKEKRNKRINNLAKNLKLNKDQIKKIISFYDEQDKSIISIKKMLGNELNKQDLIKGERQKLENKLISILNPEQINIYKKNILRLRKNKNPYMTGKVWILKNNS